jgi:hypothetical protein
MATTTAMSIQALATPNRQPAQAGDGADGAEHTGSAGEADRPQNLANVGARLRLRKEMDADPVGQQGPHVPPGQRDEAGRRPPCGTEATPAAAEREARQ